MPQIPVSYPEWRAEKQVISFKNKQDVIFNEIKQHKGQLDSSLTGNIETNLDGIGTFMKLQRNNQTSNRNKKE